MLQLWHSILAFPVAAILLIGVAHAENEIHKVLLRDVATVEGVRDNSLVGYGLVVGLKGTGDRQQTYFTVQTLASILARMGCRFPPPRCESTMWPRCS